tara:strand:+ start:1136 stop:1282 length:147 start_codon:yes stop_codon:yes gene_type:complete
MFKTAYKKFWVPILGRFISKFIPLIEGKPPSKRPTYDIDGDNNEQNDL